MVVGRVPRLAGAAAFAGAAAGGAVMGYLAERRALRDVAPTGGDWEELRRPVTGRPVPVVAADGTRLHAEVLGAGGPGTPTIVLVHGYGLSQQAWHYQRRDLRADHRLVAYDQRGHARSARPASGDYSVDALGRDLAAVLEACVPAGERVLAVGHSLGGMTLLAFAEAFPQLVRERLAGCVLIDTTGSDVLAGGAATVGIAALGAVRKGLFDRGRRLLRRRDHADPGSASPSDLSYLLTRALGLSPHASPVHVAFTEQLLLGCPNSVKAALGATLSSLDLRAAAPRLDVPCLVLVGAEDRLTPPAAARRLVELLPTAGLVELPGAGHMALLEAHQQVTAQIRRFARQLATEPGRRARQGA